MLSSFISERERIVTIEDAAELQLHQEHVVRLETRPPNVEGKGAIRQRQLVVNALRMRPDRIVVGEVRGEEALDMLQAMNTGHDGSLTTVHANTPRDALSRIETMIAMGATNLPERAMRQQIASAIQIVVQQTRLSDGSRKVTSISEITGMEGDVITMQEIFLFEKIGRDAGRQGHRPLPRDRRPAEGVRAAEGRRASTCRRTCSKASRRCGDGAPALAVSCSSSARRWSSARTCARRRACRACWRSARLERTARRWRRRSIGPTDQAGEPSLVKGQRRRPAAGARSAGRRGPAPGSG